MKVPNPLAERGTTRQKNPRKGGFIHYGVAGLGDSAQARTDCFFWGEGFESRRGCCDLYRSRSQCHQGQLWFVQLLVSIWAYPRAKPVRAQHLPLRRTHRRSPPATSNSRTTALDISYRSLFHSFLQFFTLPEEVTF
jgi:hypothetical protein